jgi:hypothetical protein
MSSVKMLAEPVTCCAVLVHNHEPYSSGLETSPEVCKPRCQGFTLLFTLIFPVRQCDLARLRSGHSVADPGTAADLARRLASLHIGQQLAAQQQANSAQLQQQAQAHSDQNAVLMQLLTTLLAQKVPCCHTLACLAAVLHVAVPSDVPDDR